MSCPLISKVKSRGTLFLLGVMNYCVTDNFLLASSLRFLR